MSSDDVDSGEKDGGGGDSSDNGALIRQAVLFSSMTVMYILFCYWYRNMRATRSRVAIETGGRADGTAAQTTTSTSDDGADRTPGEREQVRIEFIQRWLLTKKIGDVVEDESSKDDVDGVHGAVEDDSVVIQSKTTSDTAETSDEECPEAANDDASISSSRPEKKNSVPVSLTKDGKDVIASPVHPTPTSSVFCTLSNASSCLSPRGGRDREAAYVHQTCNICLCEFHTGECVAWSRNDECCHVFHAECVSKWLMKRDDCPVCRNMFLMEDDDQRDGAEHGSQQQRGEDGDEDEGLSAEEGIDADGADGADIEMGDVVPVSSQSVSVP